MSTETDPMRDRPLRRQLNDDINENGKRWQARTRKLELASYQFVKAFELTFPNAHLRSDDVGWLSGQLEVLQRVLEESP